MHIWAKPCDPWDVLFQLFCVSTTAVASTTVNRYFFCSKPIFKTSTEHIPKSKTLELVFHGEKLPQKRDPAGREIDKRILSLESKCVSIEIISVCDKYYTCF